MNFKSIATSAAAFALGMVLYDFIKGALNKKDNYQDADMPM